MCKNSWIFFMQEHTQQDIKSLVKKIQKLDAILSENNEFINFAIDSCKIDEFYNKAFNIGGFLKDNQSFMCVSPASGMFKSCCSRMAGALYSKFPQYKATGTYAQSIDNILKEEQTYLDALFAQCALHYVKYGVCILELINGKLQIAPFENYTLVNGLLCSVGALNDVGLQILNTAGFEAYKDKEYQIINYEGMRYIRLPDNLGYVELDKAPLSSLVIYDNLPFVAYVYHYFYAMEELILKALVAQKGLRAKGVSYMVNKDKVGEFFNTVDGIIELNSSGSTLVNKGIEDIINWIPIDNLVSILNAIWAEIANLEQKIISTIDMQDLFINKAENPNESTIAAQNRIEVSQLSLRAKQKGFNNFFENAIAEFVAKKLHVLVAEIELEIDSVTILDEQQRQVTNEADVAKILQLLQMAEAGSLASLGIYFKMIDEVISKSSLDNELKDEFQSAKTQLRQLKENPPPNPIQELELQIKQTELAKKQAELQKATAEATKLQTEANLLPQKIKIDGIEAAQSVAETQRRVQKDTQQSKKWWNTWKS